MQENPLATLSPNAKLALAAGAGAVVVGGLVYAFTRPAAAAPTTTVVLPPAPLPPPPLPPTVVVTTPPPPPQQQPTPPTVTPPQTAPPVATLPPALIPSPAPPFTAYQPGQNFNFGGESTAQAVNILNANTNTSGPPSIPTPLPLGITFTAGRYYLRLRMPIGTAGALQSALQSFGLHLESATFDSDTNSGQRLWQAVATYAGAAKTFVNPTSGIMIMVAQPIP